MKFAWYPQAGGIVLAFVVASAWSTSQPAAQGDRDIPTFRVDPLWPKPLPSITDADGLVRQWVTGQVGASCIDSHDHIVTVNRGFLPGGLLAQEGTQSIPAPPVTLYDPAGNIVESWGDATLTSAGAAAVLPHGIHGCFVDAQDNI